MALTKTPEVGDEFITASTRWNATALEVVPFYSRNVQGFEGIVLRYRVRYSIPRTEGSRWTTVRLLVQRSNAYVTNWEAV